MKPRTYLSAMLSRLILIPLILDQISQRNANESFDAILWKILESQINILLDKALYALLESNYIDIYRQN